MSDDFGTVNYRRGEQYRKHREALAQLLAEAPSEELANEYRRVLRVIEELDAGPGMRPLVSAPAVELPESDVEPRSRLPLIVVIALLALAGIGWLIWRAISDRAPEESTIVEDTAATASTPPETTTTAPAPASALSVTPPSHDYGVIRKGTRATRQYEVTNNSEEPITIEVARSACRCLFYEYRALVPPKAKESLTVTVDGARAKAGPLRETIAVSAKSDASVHTTFDVIATVQ